MGMRVRRFDFWNENLILRITWDEGTSIGKEEDRPFLSGLLNMRNLWELHIDNKYPNTLLFGKSAKFHSVVHYQPSKFKLLQFKAP